MGIRHTGGFKQHGVRLARQVAVGMYSKSISNFLPGKMVPRLGSEEIFFASKIGDKYYGQKSTEFISLLNSENNLSFFQTSDLRIMNHESLM